MGMNTPVLILNDAIHFIGEDSDFGKKLHEAVMMGSSHPNYRHAHGVEISSSCFVNAATVLSSHYADSTVLLSCGGNLMRTLVTIYSGNQSLEVTRFRLLEALADSMGFKVVPK